MFDAWEHKCPKCHRIGALQWNCRTKILHCIWRDCDYEERIPEFQAEPSDFQLEHFLANHGVMLDVPFYGLPRVKVFKISGELVWNNEISWLLEAHENYFMVLVLASWGLSCYTYQTDEYYYQIVK